MYDDARTRQRMRQPGIADTDNHNQGALDPIIRRSSALLRHVLKYYSVEYPEPADSPSGGTLAAPSRSRFARRTSPRCRRSLMR